MLSAQVRFLRRSCLNWGTTKGNRLTCQDGENSSQWWKSSSKYKALQGTEFGMGMTVGEEGWEWDAVEAEVKFCCTFLEDYDKEFRFLIIKGSTGIFEAEKWHLTDVQFREMILVSLWRIEYEDQRGRDLYSHLNTDGAFIYLLTCSSIHPSIHPSIHQKSIELLLHTRAL